MKFGLMSQVLVSAMLVNPMWRPTSPADDEKPTDDKKPDEPKPDDKPGDKKPDEPKTFTEDYVKALRSEAANHRTIAKDLQKQLDEVKNAGMTAEQQKDAKIAEYEKKIADLALASRSKDIALAANKLNAIDPDVVAALVPADAGNIELAIQELKQSKPFLFKGSGNIDAGSGTGDGDGPKTDMNALIRRGAGRST